MKRTLLFLTLLLTLVLGCQSEQAQRRAESVLPANKQEAQWHDNSHGKHSQAAILSDARNSYRVCNTRPQRLLPSQGAKNERTTGKPSPLDRYHFTSHCKHFLAGKDRLETAPFQFVVSRDYYIIALRRILR